MQKILDLTHAGGVTVNDTLLHIANDHLPFGGVGHSGMGAYHGKYGFDSFTHFKPVLNVKNYLGLRSLSGTKTAHPPYGKTIRYIINFLSK